MPYKDKTKQRSAQKAWLERNPEHSRWYNIKRKYGLSKEEWQKMFEEQGGCCAICSRHQDTYNRPLHVDHCHTTGKIRGLLCWKCNEFLGLIKDSVPTIEKMISYINGREPKVDSV